jgi:colicin import membrane protein
VAQLELEAQLKVWKDLAVSKQVLMGAATEALGLDPNCSTTELKAALDRAIKRAKEADIAVKNAQEQAAHAIAAMEGKVVASQKALHTAEMAKTDALTALQATEERLEMGRIANAQELRKVQLELTEKQKSLKAINLALADTPENVVKKLKALKKQKMDEATARKRSESYARSLRKEKLSLEQRQTEMQATLENASKLVDQYRDLYKLCQSLHDQLKPLVEDPTTLPALPELDEQWLDTLKPTAADETNDPDAGQSPSSNAGDNEP